MAQVFVEDGLVWAVEPLAGSLFVLRGDPQTSLRPQPVAQDTAACDRAGSGGDSGGSEAAGEPRPLLVRVSAPSAAEQWAVVHRPGDAVRVNGTALATGIRALSHRDELRVTGVAGRVFFSLERLPRVVPFVGGEDVRCPRCQQPIAVGSPAVCCPQCGVWYHESEEFGCWTYGPTCALCDQRTDLEAGFQWTPEEVLRHD